MSSTDPTRKRLAGPAIAVRGNDIDTDRIIPARFLRCVTFDGLGEHAFEDDRKQLKERGEVHPFDQPQHADATILLVNENFGCGSSREHAPQALMRWNKGIQAVIGESFAEIFFGNCISLGIPCLVVLQETVEELMKVAEDNPNAEFVVDVENAIIEVNGDIYKAEIPEGPQMQFVKGAWDTTAELLDLELVGQTASDLPYVKHWK